jgi:hypothetical protein
MALFLRNTGLSSPAFAEWADYCVIEDGQVNRTDLRGSPYPARVQMVLEHHRHTLILLSG